MKGKIVVLVAVILLVVGLWLGLSSSFFKPQLTIASFEKEVTDELSPYLNLVVHDYWVDGNKVLCKGTVNCLEPGKFAVSEAKVCMFIKPAGANSVHVEVMLYSGGLILKSDTIDSDSVEVPTLGEKVYSFDFSLSCTYK